MDQPLEPRPDPETLLRQIQVQERECKRGRLKIFLGYWRGVGKSYRMFDEARRRLMRGEDVVVGAIQETRSAELERLLNHFEFVPALMPKPTRAVDSAAILKRRPGVCVIDPLAWENPRGSRHGSRWQDVEQLLANGISVITALNVQYIDELRGRAERITGKFASHGVPRAFVATADEIEIVDVPPHMLPGSANVAGIPQRSAQLSEMRELALLAAADIVDTQLETYLASHGLSAVRGPQERILICLTPQSSVGQMIEAGKRHQERFHGEIYALYVRQAGLSEEQQDRIDRYLSMARSAGAEVLVTKAENPVEAILNFCREKRVTQIYIGHSKRRKLWHRLFGNPVDKLLRHAEGIDVQIFPG